MPIYGYKCTVCGKTCEELQKFGDTLWTNLIALSSLEGQDGRSVEIQSDGEYIQWRLVGDATWIDIIPISDLKGVDGKSAYQSYLDTTSDVPPLSESEWANLYSTKVSEAPIDGIDYVRQNGTWVSLPERIGAGFESNVYLSNTDSSTAGYKKLLYDADTGETIKTIVANNNTVQGEKYLYDFAIETTTINPGIYKFAFYGNISSITGGTSRLNARVFLYNTSGGETTLFTAPKILTNTVNGLIDFAYNITSVISCNSTDRLGIQISLTTTRKTNTTLTYYLGDGHPSYFVTTLPYRHKNLRDLSWLQSGHKGTASKPAGFDSFGNAAEIDKLPSTAITISPTVLNNLLMSDIILSQLVDKFDLGQFKKTTYHEEYDNGNSGVAKPIDWANGQNQRIYKHQINKRRSQYTCS